MSHPPTIKVSWPCIMSVVSEIILEKTIPFPIRVWSLKDQQTYRYCWLLMALQRMSEKTLKWLKWALVTKRAPSSTFTWHSDLGRKWKFPVSVITGCRGIAIDKSSSNNCTITVNDSWGSIDQCLSRNVWNLNKYFLSSSLSLGQRSDCHLLRGD